MSEFLTAFRYRALRFIQPLSPYRHNPPTRVWKVEADSCLYAVKLVDFQLRALEIASDLLNSSCPYTDDDADSQSADQLLELFGVRFCLARFVTGVNDP
jgi:hypothetical protein